MKSKMARFILLAGFIASALQASQIVIATQDGSAQPGTLNQIGVLNPTTGAVTGAQTVKDGGGNDVQLFDIAVDNLGAIWGIDSQRRLHTVNAATGVATLFAGTLAGLPAGSNLNGLDFDPITGLLYFSSNDPPVGGASRLYATDLSTCALSTCTLSNFGTPPLPAQGSGGDIAFRNGELFFGGDLGTVYRMVQTNGLWSLASTGVNTNSLTVKGSDNSIWGVTIKGMVFDGVNLYAGVGINPATPGYGGPHALLQIDPVTLNPIGGPIYISGIARTTSGLGANNASAPSSSVPEPSTFVSVLGALASFYVVRRARLKS